MFFKVFETRTEVTQKLHQLTIDQFLIIHLGLILMSSTIQVRKKNNKYHAPNIREMSTQTAKKYSSFLLSEMQSNLQSTYISEIASP